MSTDPLRDVEAELREGERLFDLRLAALRGITPDPRRAHIEALAQQGATEGERAAARAALHRLDEADDAEQRALQDLRDEEEAAEAGAL